MTDKPMPNFHFKFMNLLFILREYYRPRKIIIEEIGIKPGHNILEFGTGPGFYTIPAAELVGEKGKIFAIDFHPLAIESVKKKALQKGLKNIETIKSDCATGLSDNFVDIIFLHDVYHEFSEPDKILAELHRVLKPEGILSYNDHSVKGDKAVSALEKGGLFKLARKGKRVYIFAKV